MDLTGFCYGDLKMLSEVLTQYVENDAEVQPERDERGEAEPDAAVRARAMLDAVEVKMLALLA